MTEVEQLCKCSRCHSTKLLETYFSKNRKGEYYKTCNSCRTGHNKYNQENKETIKTKKQVYVHKNKKYIQNWKQEYYRQNQQKIKVQQKERYEKNKENIQEQAKLYYEQNKERHREKRKEWRENNKDKIKLRHSEYCKAKRHHCEHNTAKSVCRVCSPYGNLKQAVSARIRHALKAKKSKRSLEYLGCDIPMFRTHLEEQFKENMMWENYGEWEIDHIIPVLYKQDGIDPSIEEVSKRLHYTNCQPMWKRENAKKGNRYIGDYQPSDSEDSSSDSLGSLSTS